MLARVHTFSLDGLEPRHVTVEVDIRPGLPAFSIVGLGDTAVRESRERVRAALQNSGFEFPLKRIVANLAPASLRKSGPAFDVAIAAAILAASEQVPLLSLDGLGLFGELSLGGEIRGCRGTLAAAEGAVNSSIGRFLVPPERLYEASLVEGLEVGAVADLRELAAVLKGDREPRPAGEQPEVVRDEGPDLRDVRGQAAAVRALVISAAGAHNLLLEGPPGVGKTMLARRLPSLLPMMSRSEALEVTRIHSVSGLHHGEGLVAQRPFRAPHHTVSAAALVGGGSIPTPGEVTLAHRGVLFLDEMSEFARNSLEALRQPLEDGQVSISRRGGTARFPARALVVAATNPCPCGAGPGSSSCRCDQSAVDRHARRLSGPIVDRFDLRVNAHRPTAEQLEHEPTSDSSSVAQVVSEARLRQSERWKGLGFATNSEAPESALLEGGAVSAKSLRMLRDAYDRGLIAPRGRTRVLRVARTLADLDGKAQIAEEHLLEALALRTGPGSA